MHHLTGKFEDVMSLILLVTIIMLEICSIIMYSAGVDLLWVISTLSSPWLLFVLFLNILAVCLLVKMIIGWIKNDKSSSASVPAGGSGLELPIPKSDDKTRSHRSADGSGEDSSGERDNSESSSER